MLAERPGEAAESATATGRVGPPFQPGWASYQRALGSTGRGFLILQVPEWIGARLILPAVKAKPARSTGPAGGHQRECGTVILEVADWLFHALGHDANA